MLKRRQGDEGKQEDQEKRAQVKKMKVSMDFVSQEHGVPRDGPKYSNPGGCTWEILDRNETR
jgi:hypothetical protein